MSRIRKLIIVTTGTQNNGAVVTREMLESAVANFDADARPPVLLGHPQEGDCQYAAYGRVDNPVIQENADSGELELGELELIVDIVYSDYLVSLEDSGDFEGFSIGLYPCIGKEGWYIHHVAILGSLPPAADTKTLEVVNLSAVGDGNHAVHLSATLKEESILDMKKSELIALVNTAVSSAVSALQPASAVILSASNEPNTQAVATVESAEMAAMKVSMEALQETTKASRINEIKTLAAQKGMSDAEVKPIVDSLEATSAVNLCDNSTGGIYTTMRAVINAKEDKKESVFLSNNSLFQPLGVTLSTGGERDVELANVAEDSGF